jgi:TolB-like protein/Tfp pilus assembly protein PilF
MSWGRGSTSLSELVPKSVELSGKVVACLRSSSAQSILLVTIGILAAVASAGAVWWQVNMAPPEKTFAGSPTNSVAAGADGSIAVLPFTNLDGRPELDYLSNGLATDIIAVLSKFSNLLVISSESSFQYRNTSKKAREIGKELGVRYLVVGSLKNVDRKLVVQASLVDTADDRRGWTIQLQDELGSALAIRNKLTRKIVSGMAIRIVPEHGNIQEAGGTKNAAAHDAFLQGWEHFVKRTADDMVRATSNFRSAIALDPDFARARAALAATYLISRRHLWHRSLGFESSYAAEIAARITLREAMKIPTPLAHRVAAELYVSELRIDEALSEIERAVALDPNDPENYARLSITLTWAGRPKEAVDAIISAMQLNPFYPAYYQTFLGISKFALGDFENAAEHLQRAHRRDEASLLVLGHLLAAEGQLGRMRDAQATLKKINDLRHKKGVSQYSIRVARERLPYKNQRDFARFTDGLRKARVPAI